MLSGTEFDEMQETLHEKATMWTHVSIALWRALRTGQLPRL